MPAATQRIAHLVLLLCTVLGIAALHTIGHAAVITTDHHSATEATEASPATPTIRDGDGCDGDGCIHELVTAGYGRDGSPRWEACVATLDTLNAGALAAALALLAVLGRSITPVTLHRFRVPDVQRHSSLGLTLTSLAVVRT